MTAGLASPAATSGMWGGPLAAVALLLGLAGIIKLARPRPLARGLSQAGFPSSALFVRTVAAGELVVAGMTLAGGASGWMGAPALATMATYLGFAAFLVVARRRGGPLTSCGCFGRADTPVTTAHLILDLAAAAVAGAAFVTGAPSLPASLAAHPGNGPALLVAVAGLAAVGYVAFAVAPTVRVAAVRVAAGPVAGAPVAGAPVAGAGR